MDDRTAVLADDAPATEQFQPGDRDRSGDGDGADRGSLVIAEKVYEKLAEQAATEVDGVLRDSSGLDRLTRRGLPSASATVAGSHVRLSLEVAVRWPQPLPTVTASVRDRVAERLASLVGSQVDAVDVVAARIIVTQSAAPARVR